MNKPERSVAIEFTAETGWLTHYCEGCSAWAICCPDCGVPDCESFNPCCTRYKLAIKIALEKLQVKLDELYWGKGR